MSKIKIIQIFTAILLLMTQWHVVANSEKGIITGVVTELTSGEKLVGVNIQIENTMLGASSDGKGRFVIYNVPVGVYNIRASMIGHRPQVVKDIKVESNEEVTLSIKLESTVIDFDPLVVTANKMQKELDSTPSSISVVTSNEIRRRNVLRVDETLKTVPGVNFIRDQVNIRGSTGYTIGAANRTLLLLDGVPVMSSDTGQFNWDLLPVLDIERIEVVKGAGSALWGTSALGGVINIITKSPTEEGRTFLRLTAGEYDEPRYEKWKWTKQPLQYGRADFLYNKRFGPIGLRFSVGRHVSTGYTEAGDFRRWNVSGKLTYNFKNGSKWTWYSSYNFRNEGLYVGWDDPEHPFEVAPANRNSRGEMKMASIYTKYNWILSTKAALKFRLSYLMTLMGNQFVQTADFNPARGFGAEIQGDYLQGKNLDLTYGVEFKWDTGNTKYFGDHEGYTIGLYGQAEYRVQENLRVTPGLRYDRYKLIGGLSQSLLSPRMGVNWKPFSATIFRISAGSGFRAATIAERYLSFENNSVIVEANEDLKAETSWSYDIGIKQYLQQNWYFEVSAFRNDFHNLIEVDLRQSQINFAQDIKVAVKFQNLLEARIQGIEIASVGHWWRDRLRLKVSATLMEHENLITHEPLTYRPEVIAFFNPCFCWGDWEALAEFQYASRIEAVKLFRYDDRVPQKIWDFRLIYHFANYDFHIAVNNAFDYYYTQLERSMAEIRNFSVGVMASF